MWRGKVSERPAVHPPPLVTSGGCRNHRRSPSASKCGGGGVRSLQLHLQQGEEEEKSCTSVSPPARHVCLKVNTQETDTGGDSVQGEGSERPAVDPPPLPAEGRTVSPFSDASGRPSSPSLAL